MCIGSTSTAVTQLAQKTTEFGEMTQNNGHYVVQDHPRSPSVVPI